MFKAKIIISVLILLTSCTYNSGRKKSPKAVKGVIDLTGWDFQKDGSVKLNGQWDFYWNTFLDPADVLNDDIKEKKYYATLPANWSSCIDASNGEKLSFDPFGGATYVLKIKGVFPENRKHFSIKLVSASTSYKLFFLPGGNKNNKSSDFAVNRPLMENGTVSLEEKIHVPQYLPSEEQIPLVDEVNHIVIHVSNFTYYQGGILHPVILGHEKNISEETKSSNYKSIILLAIIFMMSIYHFALFTQIRENKSTLYFAIFCFLIIIRELCMGRYFATFWSEPSSFVFEVLLKIEYFTLILSAPMIYTFFHSAFRKDYPIIKVRIVWFCSFIYGIIILFTQYKFFLQFLIYFQFVIVVSGIAAVIFIFIAALRRRVGAFSSFFGAMIFYFSVVHDILITKEIIYGPFLVTIGFMGFIFSQSFIIVRIFVSIHRRSERLNIELTDMNINLEEKVMERTEELQAANEEMVAINEHLVKTKNALWGEMELAKKIQTALLPEDPKIPGYQICSYMKPSENIGGDYYDVINCEGFNWIVIGDVSGHGVVAGLVMMMVQTAIHVVLDQHPDASPGELLVRINRTIYNNIRMLKDDLYMTITVLSSFDNEKFHFAGLHQDIYVYRAKKDEIEIIETDGCWIGVRNDINDRMENFSLSLESGDVMLLYTDGITEAWVKGSERNNRDPETDMYGQEKLISLLKKNVKKNVGQIKQAILESLDDYILSDDVTFVVLSRD